MLSACSPNALRQLFAQDLVKESGGVLGCAVCCGENGGKSVDDMTTCGDELPALLDKIIRVAAARGLDLDFHVDENGNTEATGLRSIAQAVSRNNFTGKVVCGHCCSLSSQPSAARAETLELCRRVGLYIVTLPVVNMWLQDRDHHAKRTPRWRGTTAVKEVADAGVHLAIASDNIRDQFFAYGDMDLFDIFRQSVWICHLDRPNMGAWPAAVSSVPAAAMNLSRDSGWIAEGGMANFVMFNARCYSELFSRPQADRVVVRDGASITRRLPGYSELDEETAPSVEGSFSSGSSWCPFSWTKRAAPDAAGCRFSCVAQSCWRHSLASALVGGALFGAAVTAFAFRLSAPRSTSYYY